MFTNTTKESAKHPQNFFFVFKFCTMKKSQILGLKKIICDGFQIDGQHMNIYKDKYCWNVNTFDLKQH